MGESVWDFLKIAAVLPLIIVLISVNKYYNRVESINTAKEENWSWYFNGDEVDYELFDINKFDLSFDYENNRVLMSERNTVRTVVMPIAMRY